MRKRVNSASCIFIWKKQRGGALKGLFNPKRLSRRKRVLVLTDGFLICVFGILSVFLMNIAMDILNLPVHRMATGVSVYTIALNVLFIILMLGIFGMYNRIWRTLGFKDAVLCVGAVAIGQIISVATRKALELPVFSEFELINMILCSSAIVLFRFLFKRVVIFFTQEELDKTATRTLIVGAGAAGKIISDDIAYGVKDPNNPINQLYPVGFVDDDRAKQNSRVGMFSVLGTTEDIPAICEKYGVQQIIFAIPSCDNERRKEILEICSKTTCKIKVLPYISEVWRDEDETALSSKIRDINFNDLLGREPVKIDDDAIKTLLEGKVVMVTGGGGSIGSELVRQIAKNSPKQLIIVDIYENNAYDIQQEIFLEYGRSFNLVVLIASVRDRDKMTLIFDKYRPNVVFHAAAHKHVPLMETSPEEAVKNNVFGTFNVADLADAFGVEKFVMVSTDKAVNPTNVMGATKRCCEMIVEYKSQVSKTTSYITTRFGNVLGSNGSVIPLFRRQIETGKPVTVTDPEMTRYFMTIPEACSLVLEAGAMAKGGEIFVLDMGKPVKILTLAENLIRMYGKRPYVDVEIKFTGLRPGEKIYEELLMSEEGLSSTPNKKIFIGKHLNVSPDELLKNLNRLHRAAEANDSDLTVEMLERMVPTFNHNNHKNPYYSKEG